MIVVLVFGTKKLTGLGSDLGKAIKEFKDGVNGVEKKDDKATTITYVDKT